MIDDETDEAVMQRFEDPYVLMLIESIARRDDEIEELQHHIEEHQSRDALQQMAIERLQAENERLREAIARIACIHGPQGEWGDSENKTYKIAHEALQDKDDG